jgi:hypothetical protein
VFLTGHHEAIKERWFASASELLRPVKIALDKLYPGKFRIEGTPLFDADMNETYEDKRHLAESFRNEQRNIVNNDCLPRYDIALATPGSEGGAAYEELEALIVDNCLDRLMENLGAYAPMILPGSKAAEVTETLVGIRDVEAARLRQFLRRYKVTLRPEYTPIGQDKD